MKKEEMEEKLQEIFLTVCLAYSHDSSLRNDETKFNLFLKSYIDEIINMKFNELFTYAKIQLECQDNTKTLQDLIEDFSKIK